MLSLKKPTVRVFVVLFTVLSQKNDERHIGSRFFLNSSYSTVHVPLRGKITFKPRPQNGTILPLRVFFVRISDTAAMVREK